MRSIKVAKLAMASGAIKGVLSLYVEKNTQNEEADVGDVKQKSNVNSVNLTHPVGGLCSKPTNSLCRKKTSSKH